MLRPTAPALTAGDLLTLPEIRHLGRISGVRGAGLVLHAWGTIAAAMLVYAAWPSAITLVAAVAVVGARQLGLAVLMHEATHWRLFTRGWANTRVARWCCAYPVGGELVRYRQEHHLHHRHTLQAEDPDLELALHAPVARTTFWLGVLCDLGGVTAAARVLAERPWRDGLSTAWSRWRGPLAVNTALFSVLAALGAGHLYLLLWIVPLATWYQFLTRLRNLAEHAFVADGDDPLRNARTVVAGPLARSLVAPYWMNFHLEHHLLPFVPSWKLRQAHALLLARGHGPRMEIASSYLDVIRRATSPR